jgi:Fe-S-cluster containining protein
MNNMTAGEQKMFAKYWGVQDLQTKEEFWEEAFLTYSEANVPVSMIYNPNCVRFILDELNCPPGVCGECCHYPYTTITFHDMQRIAEHTEHTMDELKALVKTENGLIWLDGSKGCPFLKDKACSIWKYRPDICWLFPIQGALSSKATETGNAVKQMSMRIKCRETFRVLRKMITYTLSDGKGLLLPNLTIIPKYTADSG